MAPIRRSGLPPQEAAPTNNTSAISVYRRTDGYAAPTAQERREAALLEELHALGYTLSVRCLICRKPLTSPQSLRAHVGPVCLARMAVGK